MGKAILVGLLVTIVLYFVPVVDLIAPLIGGGISGYMVNQGIWGGVKAGLIMALVMLIPGVAVAFALGLILGALGVPLLGGIAGAAWVVLYLFIMAHTVVLGVLGAGIGGALPGTRRI